MEVEGVKKAAKGVGLKAQGTHNIYLQSSQIRKCARAEKLPEKYES